MNTDDYHLMRANQFMEKLNLPKSMWRPWKKINARRRKLIMERMAEEEIADPKQFWDHTEEIYLPFDTNVVFKPNKWSVADAKVWLRVPKREHGPGSKDHYLAAYEGEYRDWKELKRRKTEKKAFQESLKPKTSKDEQPMTEAEIEDFKKSLGGHG